MASRISRPRMGTPMAMPSAMVGVGVTGAGSRLWAAAAFTKGSHRSDWMAMTLGYSAISPAALSSSMALTTPRNSVPLPRGTNRCLGSRPSCS